MLYTKVKLFQSGATGSGEAQKGGIEDLESRINDFLLQNPRVQLMDIKLTSVGAPAGKAAADYGCIALVIYEES